MTVDLTAILTILIPTVGGLATLVAQNYFQERTRRAERQWDRSEALLKAGELAAITKGEAADLATITKGEAARVHLALARANKVSHEQRSSLSSKLDALSGKADAAYKEANDVNGKIHRLGLAQQTASEDQSAQLVDIDKTTLDTNERVQRLETEEAAPTPAG